MATMQLQNFTRDIDKKAFSLSHVRHGIVPMQDNAKMRIHRGQMSVAGRCVILPEAMTIPRQNGTIKASEAHGRSIQGLFFLAPNWISSLDPCTVFSLAFTGYLGPRAFGL